MVAAELYLNLIYLLVVGVLLLGCLVVVGMALLNDRMYYFITIIHDIIF
jgi:hypothetical protein